MTDVTTSDTDLAGALLGRRERYRAVLDAALDCVVAMDARGAGRGVEPGRRAHVRLHRRARRSAARWPT